MEILFYLICIFNFVNFNEFSPFEVFILAVFTDKRKETVMITIFLLQSYILIIKY